MTLAAIDGRAALLLLALLVTTFYTLRAAKRANPSETVETSVRIPPIRVSTRCGTTGCGRPAFWPVTRRDGKADRVCTGCLHEGTAFGWWV